MPVAGPTAGPTAAADPEPRSFRCPTADPTVGPPAAGDLEPLPYRCASSLDDSLPSHMHQPAADSLYCSCGAADSRALSRLISFSKITCDGLRRLTATCPATCPATCHHWQKTNLICCRSGIAFRNVSFEGPECLLVAVGLCSMAHDQWPMFDFAINSHMKQPARNQTDLLDRGCAIIIFFQVRSLLRDGSN